MFQVLLLSLSLLLLFQVYYYYYTVEQLVAIPYFSLRHSSRNKQVKYAPKVLNLNRINPTFVETE